MNVIYWHLTLLLTGILGTASLVGLGLRAIKGANNATIQNLNARIFSWWWLVALILICFWGGTGATLSLFAIASFMALREFISLTPTKASDHRPLFVAFFVAVPAQYWLIDDGWYGLFAIFIPVYLFFLLAGLSAMAQDTDDFLARTAKIQWAVMVCVYGVSHAPALLLLNIPHYAGRNPLLLFYFLFVAQSSDVFQYICGKLFGKHKVAPIASPSKTVEGLVGGGFLAVLCGMALHALTPFTLWQSAGLSAIIVLAGFLGGLILSSVKRSLGAKDWGQSVPGHGGVLDRLDSISFAAPVFFHLTRYFFT